MTTKAENVKAYHRTRLGLVTRIYHHQKSRHDVSYSREQLALWMFEQDNFETLYRKWVESGYDKYLSPSVDRLNDHVNEYTLDNISLMTWGENNSKHHEDILCGRTIKTCRPVAQFMLSGEFVQFHASASAASRSLGLSKSAVGECLAGRCRTSGGYMWDYVSEDVIGKMEQALALGNPVSSLNGDDDGIDAKSNVGDDTVEIGSRGSSKSATLASLAEEENGQDCDAGEKLCDDDFRMELSAFKVTKNVAASIANDLLNEHCTQTLVTDGKTYRIIGVRDDSYVMCLKEDDQS